MSAFRPRTILNTVGVMILLVGISSAVLVYRQGQTHAKRATAPGDWQDSSLSMTDSKTSTHDLELYSGKLGVLVAQWQDRLSRPQSVAIIIVAVAALIALACFLIAHRSSLAISSKPRIPSYGSD